MNYPEIAAVVLIAFVAALPASAADDAAAKRGVEDTMRRSFSQATTDEWKTRLKQDGVQALCSKYRNRPPPQIMRRIRASERGTFRYPADGQLIGDWREGEAIASIGTGGNIGTIRPDRPGTRQGGNCYACHALAPGEVAAGNLGPSLTGFGRLRGNSPEVVRQTYETIYNAQAFFPCSSMPRFGYHEWLTPSEIADAVAFLLDPESPVNK